MDASFDQFGGGGWGDQGEQEFASSNIQKTSIYDKIPIPADIDGLLAMPHAEEKYVLGAYSFNTIRVMGKIVSSHTDSNQSTTYEICDVNVGDERIAKRFTIIRYGGVEIDQQNMDSTFTVGKLVQAVGKIRSFNSRLSLISFHIREVTMGEISIFKMECKLARLYFEKNLLERTQGLENTIFRTGHNNKFIPTQTGTPAPRIQNTPSKVNVTTTRQNMNSNQQKQQSATQSFTQQQIKIVEFIRRFGSDANGGVYIEHIRNSLNPDSNFANDLQILQNEGQIYTSLDDNHFVIV